MKEQNRHRSATRGGVPKRLARTLALAGAFFALGLAAAPPCRADEADGARHRVLIITEDPNDPFMTRVQAEVSTLPGLEVTTQRPMSSLDADARAQRAEVAIRKVASGKGVEVWMADATSGRSLLRQLVVDESPNGPDQGLVALQTAELLRTGLVGKPVAPPAPPPQTLVPPPPPAVVEPPLSPPRAHALSAGVGPLWSPGGVGTGLQGWLTYQYLWSPHFGVSIDASAPLHRGSLSGAQGSAQVGVLLAGGGLLARLHSAHAEVAGTATLGAAFASVFTKGEPNASYLGSSTHTPTGLVYLRLGVTWRPIPWLGLGVAGLVGTTTSRLHVRFAKQDVGDFGTPLTAATLYGEIAW